MVAGVEHDTGLHTPSASAHWPAGPWTRFPYYILFYIVNTRYILWGHEVEVRLLFESSLEMIDEWYLVEQSSLGTQSTKGVMTVTRQVLRKIVAITAVVRVWNSPIKVYNGDNNLALTSQPMFHDKFAHKTVYNVFSSRADRHNLVQMRHCRNIMTVKL